MCHFQEEPEKPTKEEYEVAKFLRFNVPSKEAKLMSLPVQCFVGEMSTVLTDHVSLCLFKLSISYVCKINPQ